MSVGNTLGMNDNKCTKLRVRNDDKLSNIQDVRQVIFKLTANVTCPNQKGSLEQTGGLFDS